MGFCFWLAIALVCTYKMVQAILENVKWRKLVCIFWWFVTIDAVIVLEYICFGIELTEGGTICILIGAFFLAKLSMDYILKDRDLWSKISIWGGWFVFLFLLSFLSSQISIEFMYIFKILIMLMLLMGMLIIKNALPIIKIIMSIIFYLGMIIFDVMLTTGFLFSTVDKAVETIYIGFQRIYSLNPLSSDYQKGELLTNIVDFLICRIMDVIFLSFLSSTFIEIYNKNLKQKPEMSSMKG